MYIGALDPVSNRADWRVTREIVDDDTAELVSLAGALIRFDVRDQRTRATLLQASTADGRITIDDVGTFTVAFSAADMQPLCAGIYDVGCTITLNGATHQFIIGTVTVLDGVVSR
jgi:hypothetical protein